LSEKNKTAVIEVLNNLKCREELHLIILSSKLINNNDKITLKDLIFKTNKFDVFIKFWSWIVDNIRFIHLDIRNCGKFKVNYYLTKDIEELKFLEQENVTALKILPFINHLTQVKKTTLKERGKNLFDKDVIHW
jgi:hypothetical protein